MIEAIKRILVVDDEPEFVNSIKRHLKREGFILDSAPDGEDAHLKIRNSACNGAPYDLVITDVIMPNTGGIELLHWIKKNHPEISVLVVSAFGETDVVMETIRPEIDDYCKKPLTPEEMMGLIGSVDCKRRLICCQRKETTKTEHNETNNQKDQQNQEGPKGCTPRERPFLQPHIYRREWDANSPGRESIPLKIRINDIITMEDA